MEEWSKYTLPEIASFSQGKQIPVENQINAPQEGYIRFIRIVDYTSGWTQAPRYVECDSKYHINSDDIVMIRYGTPGKVFRGVRGLIANNMFKITVDESIITKDYAFWYLSQEKVYQQLLSSQSSTTMPAISFGMLKNVVIEVPPIIVQNRICRVLNSIQAKIDLNNRINHNLEQQAQALYKSWFIDFEPFKNGKFVDSELGTIPEGWRVGTLSELGDIVAGGTPSKARADYYTDNGIHWLTPKDLSNRCDKYTSRGETDITELGYYNSSAKLMPRGSVLFSSRAPIGYITIAKNDICTNQGFKSVIPKYAGTYYIYYWLSDNTDNIESQSSGSTFKEASGSLMKCFPALIPPKEILDCFEKRLEPLMHQQEILEEEIHNLSCMRDHLLPDLMSGVITTQLTC